MMIIRSCANLPPYVMEGNAGPASKMATAVAAYTPNIPWARLGVPDWIDLDGEGTSAATPQVAAAAALWLHKNGGNYPAHDWRRAEAVRRALLDTAFLGSGARRPDPLLASGLLRAADALATTRIENLTQTPRDDASFAFLHLLSSIFDASGNEPIDLYKLELTQLALLSRAAQDAMPDPEIPVEKITTQRRRFLQAILDEGRSSRALHNYLSRTLGVGSVGSTTPSPTDRSGCHGHYAGGRCDQQGNVMATNPAGAPRQSPAAHFRHRPWREHCAGDGIHEHRDCGSALGGEAGQ
jgi:hypothetical protein